MCVFVDGGPPRNWRHRCLFLNDGEGCASEWGIIAVDSIGAVCRHCLDAECFGKCRAGARGSRE